MAFETLKTKKHSSECPKCKDKPFVFCQCSDYLVKQLSDEEIEKIYWNMESSVLTKEGIVDFARAIIKEITE